MAGAGFKTFSAGEVLLASEVNTYLMQQAVMVFGSSAVRATAIATPSEGMLSYLSDSDSVEAYNGTAWEAVGGGDVLAAGTGISLATSNGTTTITNSLITIIDAAGDLLYGTADNTATRLALGTSGQVLKVNSGATAPEWGAAPTSNPYANGTAFNSSGTFTVPTGVTSAFFMLTGGGGGGGGANDSKGGVGGGGGAVVWAELAVTPAENLTITIGAGGSGGAATSAGSTGGTTSVSRTAGTALRAVGGSGGVGASGQAATPATAGGVANNALWKQNGGSSGTPAFLTQDQGLTAGQPGIYPTYPFDSVAYGGGGGAGNYGSGAGSLGFGGGGQGGSGSGGTGGTGQAGTANTGGGGGGGGGGGNLGGPGGAGGSGVVRIFYA